MSPPRVHVRVKLSVNIDVGDAWGTDCPISQIEKQATVQAVGTLRQMIDEFKSRGITLIEDPRVTMTIVSSQ